MDECVKSSHKYNFTVPQRVNKKDHSQTVPVSDGFLAIFLHILNPALAHQPACDVIHQDSGQELDSKHVSQFGGLAHVQVLEAIVLVGEVGVAFVKAEGDHFEEFAGLIDAVDESGKGPAETDAGVAPVGGEVEAEVLEVEGLDFEFGVVAGVDEGAEFLKLVEDHICWVWALRSELLQFIMR